MLGDAAADLKHTRFYQDVFCEGRQEGELALRTRQLTRRIGPLSPMNLTPLQGLNLEQLEFLGEALFDFSGTTDLGARLGKTAP